MAQRDVLPEPCHLSSKRPNDPSRRTFESTTWPVKRAR